MNIKLGDFSIKTNDALNIVLTRKYVSEHPKAKGEKEIERIVGYYGTLEQALRSYVKSAVFVEAEDAKGIQELFEALERIEKTVKQVSQNFKE